MDGDRLGDSETGETPALAARYVAKKLPERSSLSLDKMSRPKVYDFSLFEY
jgi:hypothetical protein